MIKTCTNNCESRIRKLWNYPCIIYNRSFVFGSNVIYVMQEYWAVVTRSILFPIFDFLYALHEEKIMSFLNYNKASMPFAIKKRRLNIKYLVIIIYYG